ncbi:MAG: HDOD domain-containing protein [Aestuariibacter sp.]
MLGKLISWLTNQKTTEHLEVIDASQVSPSSQKKPAKPHEQPSAMELFEKKYQEITDADIAQASQFLDRKDFMFYDFLLGKSQKQKDINPLERKILSDTNKLLDKPDVIIKLLPQLPQSVLKLKNMLGKDDFNVHEFTSLIDKEPGMASHLIKVANSPLYNHSKKEISDLTHAFMMLGAEAVKEHVLMRFFNQIIRIQPIYFKMFGEKLWAHSLLTANLAKQLASNYKVNPETAYLTGLVHDLGKLLIFQLMVNAFKSANPDEKPESLLFKKIINAKSMTISIMVVSQWQMPQDLVTAVVELSKSRQKEPESPLGKTLFEANLVSELSVMKSAKTITPEHYLVMAKESHLSDMATTLLLQQVMEEKTQA